MNKSGVVLVILGGLFLAANHGLLDWRWVRLWWPLVLIGIGVWLIVSRRGRSSRHDNDLTP